MNTKSLTRDYLRDLVIDIRCALRDNRPEYEKKCRQELKTLFHSRHKTTIGKYGEINL